MNWLNEQLYKAMKDWENSQGIYLLGDDRGMAWEVTAPADHIRFLRSLDQILPAGSTLYFEDMPLADEVIEFFQARQASDICPVLHHTICPKPLFFHMPLNSDNLKDLIDLFQAHDAIDICTHFCGYHTGEVLLDWCDAFWDCPIHLSRRIHETEVKRFCEMIGSTHKLEQIGPEKE